MTDSRRYREDEVREIFGIATRGHGTDSPKAESSSAGLTLEEMQDIGLEAGIAPADVVRAAASFNRPAVRPALRTSLGMPVEIRRVVPLQRAPTDREWEQLIVELRSTFGARGRASAHGELREWSNGNLHACIEPISDGYQLRLGTRKGNASAWNALGAAAIVTGAVASGSVLMTTGITEAVFAPAMIAASGFGVFLSNFLRLPRWAQHRQTQMEHIASRVEELLKPEPKA